MNNTTTVSVTAAAASGKHVSNIPLIIRIFRSIKNELRVTGYVNRQVDEGKILWLDIPWWIVCETAAVIVWVFLIFPSLVI
jgi:hypothetical protein